MSKTFSYSILNEKAYHQKVDTWFAFIFIGIIYASLWVWVEPQTPILMTLIRITFPLILSIALLWIIGFVFTFSILLITRDLKKNNHLFGTSVICGLKLVDDIVLDKLTQSTTIRKDIVVSDPTIVGFGIVGSIDSATTYWRNVFTFEPNSFLALVLNQRQP